MYRRVDSKDLAIKNFYSSLEHIGEGTFGVVWRAVQKSTGIEFAIKTIDKAHLDQDELNSLNLEVEIISQVDHPNIVRAYEFFDEPTKLHIVMELMLGGELFEKIIEKDHYSEKEATEAIRPVIDAIRYCHEMGIVHRDLKPENLLYSSNELDGIVKISDFGLARFYDDDPMTTACGSPSYVAPEIIVGKGYGIEVDCWSLGVIIYTMLCGYQPFTGETNPELFEAIKAGVFTFPSPDWDNVSNSAKDLIRNCLILDPKERFTAKDMLVHPWIVGLNNPITNMSGVTEKIRHYYTRRRFRKYGNAAIAANKFMSLVREKSS